MQCYRLVFEGEVQGVGFRRYLWSIAMRNNVKGYVANNPNGTVEAVMCVKSREVLDRILKKLSTSPFNIVKVRIERLSGK